MADKNDASLQISDITNTTRMMNGSYAFANITPQNGGVMGPDLETMLLDRQVGTAVAYFAFCIGPLGLIGNTLTIIVLTNRTMRSSTNNYLASLAIWDSIVILGSIFLIYLTQFFQMFLYCVPYLYPLALTAQTATIWITVSFTVERWIAVGYPLRATTMCTIRRARIVILCVSIGSIFYNLPRWFEYVLINGIPSKSDFGNSMTFKRIYYSWLYPPIMCIIPLSILAVMNVFLIRTVQRSQKQRQDMNVRQSKENNVTIMLVSVVVVFIICQVPALVFNTAYAIDSTIEQQKGYMLLSHIRNLLVVINSTINFLLYCAFGQKFRRTFVRLMCPCCLSDIGRQHSFSAVSTNMNPGHKNSNAGNQYMRINNHRSVSTIEPPIRRELNHFKIPNSASLNAILNHSRDISFKTTAEQEEITLKQPILEEFELTEIGGGTGTDDNDETDTDSRETVFRHLIPEKESFSVYKVDFNKKRENGVVI